MHTIVQFSPTGNTAYIAKLLSESLKESKIYALEKIEPQNLIDDDHLILMFSVHAFNATWNVKQFVEKLPAGKFAKISLLAIGCTTGDINKAATSEIRKILESKSYEIIVDDILAMPLSFIMRFPQEIVEQQLAEANEKIKIISNKIINLEKSLVVIPTKIKVLNKIGKAEGVAAKFFGLELHAKKSCIKCGLCVTDCPSKNIRVKSNGKLKFGFKCMMCMRCIYRCPTNSITPRISKFIPIKGGYSIDKYL